MNFEINYKNVDFKITLEKENFPDISYFMSDKYHRLSPQTVLEVKKGSLWPYNVLIQSRTEGGDDEHTHYLSTILLTTNEDEIADDLADYLEAEHTLDEIIELKALYEIAPGPKWKIE